MPKNLSKNRLCSPAGPGCPPQLHSREWQVKLARETSGGWRPGLGPLKERASSWRQAARNLARLGELKLFFRNVKRRQALRFL